MAFSVGGLSFVVAIVAGCDDDPIRPVDTPSGTEISAAAGCTNPSHTGPPPGRGVEPPGFLSPILYVLAVTDYERVFCDVIDGNNDVYHLGCCDAAPGYDTASGLGSIRFDQLAEVLLERAGGP